MQINGNTPILPKTNTTPAAPPQAKTADAVAGDRVELQGTAYAGLAGYEKMVPSKGIVGADAQSAPISVSVYLKPENTAGVAGAHSAGANSSLGEVKQFAEANGLNIASVDPDTNVVKLTGGAADYQKAFGVELNNYKDHDGNVFHAYEGNLSMPQSLAGAVQTVVGLNNRPIAHTHTVYGNEQTQASGKAPKSGKGKGTKTGGKGKDVPSQGYDPRQVAQAYNFPAKTDGSGQTVAIVELGGGFKQADINSYFKGLHMDVPHIHAVGVDGAKNAPVGNPNSADGEVALDVEVVGAVAPKADIPVFFAPNSAQGFIDGVNEAVSAQVKAGKPGAVSVSWGAPQGLAFSPADEAAFAKVLDNAAAHGVNVYVASGDNGSTDGAQDGKDHVDFPSALPSVVSTGGTELQVNADGTRSQEVAWGGTVGGGGASGGGYSSTTPEPDYQTKAGIKDPTHMRGVPDIAGDAAPDSGYKVTVDGHTFPIGGTSAVAPLMSALDARERQAVGGNIGALNPTIYQHPEVFTDVTDGTNGTFNAGKGWDAVTGLGVPDGEKLAAVLKAQQKGSKEA
jgi:kumamolisin